jgi:cytochrome P450 family 109
LLLIAGHETTANLIGNAMVCFEEHPDAMEDLRSDPTLMLGAVEEILRCYPSVAGAVRSVKENTTLGDKELKKYDTVSIWVTSTNRDERQFADPEKFDIHRNPNRHLTFGHGIHFCLGAPLARIEARIALTLMLKRLPDMKRIPDQPIEPISSPFILGVKSFPLSFHIE